MTVCPFGPECGVVILNQDLGIVASLAGSMSGVRRSFDCSFLRTEGSGVLGAMADNARPFTSIETFGQVMPNLSPLQSARKASRNAA